jgi:hypothetical protein
MQELRWVKLLFLIAGLYDGILGVVFLIAPESIFLSFDVTAPYHMAFIQFPAMLLIVFAIMFFRVAIDPVKNRELILYGCGLKISYCSTVFWYATMSEISFIWIPWAWADILFLVLFVLVWKKLGSESQTR